MEHNLNSTGLSLNKAAIAAAIALTANIVFAPIAFLGILPGIIGNKDVAMVLANIIANEQQFRMAICLLTLNAIADVVVFWALYYFLKPISKSISLLAVLFGILHAVGLLSSVNNLIDLLHIAGASASSLNKDIFYSQVSTLINAFNWAWQAGMVMFGVHLLLRGWLLFKAAYMKKILGIVMWIVGVAYLIDGFGQILMSCYNTPYVSSAVGALEALLIVWLLVKGRKTEHARRENEKTAITSDGSY
jgi:hypothetical protein